MATVAIVGASLAGASAAQAIRAAGFDGNVVLIGDEAHPPYNRPPLSKEMLVGDKQAHETAIHSPQELAALELDLRYDTAVALDAQRRTLTLASGVSQAFDGLVIATGARPRRLPFQPADAGVHQLRTLDDALRLRAALEGARSIAIVGAGFIGLEVASSARARGKEVSVVEAAAHPMADLLGPEVGAQLAELHRDRGVDLRCGQAVADFVVQDGSVAGLLLADGTHLEADVVLVGVGATPNVEWLAGSGVAVSDGVQCDEALAVGPGIYAAGDVARWPHPLLGSIRVEHWTSAADQGRIAARNLAAELAGSDKRAACDAIPYFWSDQHGTRVQLAGHLRGDERVCVLRDAGRLLALFGRDETLVAAMAWDWPKALALQRRSIAAAAPWDESLATAEQLLADAPDQKLGGVQTQSTRSGAVPTLRHS